MVTMQQITHEQEMAKLLLLLAVRARKGWMPARVDVEEPQFPQYAHTQTLRFEFIHQELTEDEQRAVQILFGTLRLL